MEYTLEVRVDDLVEGVVWERFERRAPVCAGVIHEDVKLRFACRQRRGDCPCTRFRADITRDRNARPELRKLGRGGVANVRLSRRDIDLGAGFDEPLGDHVADAARSTGNQRDLIFDREQIVHWDAPEIVLVLCRRPRFRASAVAACANVLLCGPLSTWMTRSCARQRWRPVVEAPRSRG